MVKIKSKQIAEAIATVFFVGKIPYAPGSFGSIIAFPVIIFGAYLTELSQVNIQFIEPIYDYVEVANKLVTIFLAEIIIFLIIFLLGIISTAAYLKDTEKTDPKEVVIDELAGQILTILLSSFSLLFHYSAESLNNLSADIKYIILLVIMPFLLFRFFDICKPWPINWCDRNIKGAFGVMFDDIVAAIFATTSQYAIILLVDHLAYRLNI